jgi:hypothetical protein
MLGTLVLAAATALPAAAQQTIDARRAAKADGRVEIENMAGSIHVIGWSKDEVAVSGTLGRGAEGLNLSGGGDRTQIEVETKGNPHAVRSDLEIHVPAGSRIEIDAYSAAVTVVEISGSVRVETVNGNISVSGASKEVDAESVGGEVVISGPTKRVHAESVNGAVTVRGATGEVEANTVNGRLEVAGNAIERGHLETVSGNIRFEGDLLGHGELDVESVSGGVELVLSAKTSADFELSSFSGAIENELGPAARKASHYTTEKELEFSTGSGGARISVKTLSGEIALRKH